MLSRLQTAASLVCSNLKTLIFRNYWFVWVTYVQICFCVCVCVCVCVTTSKHDITNATQTHG